MQPHILILGNPVEGFQYLGPYESYEAACTFANQDGNIDADWWVAPIENRPLDKVEA